MGVYLSPGVYPVEKDLSDVVPAVATCTAALVGYSAKGNVDDIVLITTGQQFIDEYGEPDPSTGHYFHYTALAYLAKGSQLYCLRVHNGALYGGVNIMKLASAEVNAALTVGQATSVFVAASGMDDEVLFQILGANPGVWDDKLSVVIQNVKTGSEAEPTNQYTFEILVYLQDSDGNWSQVEKWKVSRKQKLDGFGKQMYMESKINGISKYIVVADNILLADTVLPKTQATELVLNGGYDGSITVTSQLITGWAEFINPDKTDIRILVNGGETDVSVQTEMKVVAETRADCMCILDVPYNEITSVAGMVDWRDNDQNFNSSYCALYAPWVQVYDSYNDNLVDVPVSGYVAAQYAYNDYIGNPWDSPAGFDRGTLNVIGLASQIVFTQGERDTLYQAQINPIQKFSGSGIVVWGDVTEQAKASAFSHVNVRRLFIVLEKAMSISLRQFVFEGNTTDTRIRAVSMLEEYLDRLSSQGAFQTESGDRGYRVLCDQTNNTAFVIDSNQLNVDVFIKPVRSINFIQLQTIATPTGASFEELISRGVMF
jgi:phage tail sheath protein FI